MMRPCGVHKTMIALMWIGAINWGLVGFFNFNLVQWIFGDWPTLVRIIYALIGLSALLIFTKKSCKMCMKGEGDMMKK